MHILYEIEHISTSGGIERMLAEKANYLADNLGWEVTIVVLLEEQGAVPFYRLSEKIHIEYLHVKSKGFTMCLQSLWRLNRLVKRLQPDVCVTVQTIGALSTLLRSHSTPTIYEAHGIRTCMQHPIAMSIAERFANTIVVLSDLNAKRYAKARRVEKICNFTTLKCRKQADYETHHCIAMGRLDFEKNYPRMISIWKEVHYRHPDWVLDIYGEGTERAVLEETIEQNGLHSSIILHGKTTQVDDALCSGSFLLLTSLYEGFPLVLLEAAQCGLTAISFDCNDGPREIIEDGKTGYLIPYSDDNAMVEAICKLIEDHSLRKRLGEAAQSAINKFDKHAIMSQWENLFNEIARNAHS